MKLSDGATTAAARDVACGMRSSLLFSTQHTHFFLFLLHVPLPAEEEPVCFRGGVLRDNVPSLFDGITLRALPLTCAAMCPPGKFQKSYNHSRLHGDGERANIRFSWLSTFLFSPRFYLIFCACLPFISLSILLRCLSLRELFNRFPILYLYFLFLFLFFPTFLRTRTRNITKTKNCLALLLIPYDDPVLAIISICFESQMVFGCSFLCTSTVAFRHFTFSFMTFFFFVAVSTLSISVRGEISFYFQTPLLLARACRVIPFELPLWQAT